MSILCSYTGAVLLSQQPERVPRLRKQCGSIQRPNSVQDEPGLGPERTAVGGRLPARPRAADLRPALIRLQIASSVPTLSASPGHGAGPAASLSGPRRR